MGPRGRKVTCQCPGLLAIPRLPNVYLGDSWEVFVSQKLQTGDYQNVSEVIRAGLRLLKLQDEERVVKLEELRLAIREGVRAEEEGRVQEFTDETVEEIKAEGRKRRRSSSKQ